MLISNITNDFYSFLLCLVQKVFGIVKELLEIEPQMVLIPDSNGNYPIHLAIYNQQSYTTVMHFFKEVPETIMIRDENTKLLPFMLAAVGEWENQEDQISITYELLREDPHSLY